MDYLQLDTLETPGVDPTDKGYLLNIKRIRSSVPPTQSGFYWNRDRFPWDRLRFRPQATESDRLPGPESDIQDRDLVRK